LFQGNVDKIDILDPDGKRARVPLIGWYELQPPGNSVERWTETLLDASSDGAAYYFVHSFAARPAEREDVLAVVRHGTQEVVAAVQRDNVYGFQFHPERSGPNGLALLERFATLR
jgi:glutamine amidotransferase